MYRIHGGGGNGGGSSGFCLFQSHSRVSFYFVSFQGDVGMTVLLKIIINAQLDNWKLLNLRSSNLCQIMLSNHLIV